MDAISFVLGVKSAQLRSSQLKDLVYRGRRLARSEEGEDEEQEDEGEEEGEGCVAGVTDCGGDVDYGLGLVDWEEFHCGGEEGEGAEETEDEVAFEFGGVEECQELDVGDLPGRGVSEQCSSRL